eukprot:2186274-Prymnesium_polylepis.3
MLCTAQRAVSYIDQDGPPHRERLGLGIRQRRRSILVRPIQKLHKLREHILPSELAEATLLHLMLARLADHLQRSRRVCIVPEGRRGQAIYLDQAHVLWHRPLFKVLFRERQALESLLALPQPGVHQLPPRPQTFALRQRRLRHRLTGDHWSQHALRRRLGARANHRKRGAQLKLHNPQRNAL